MPGVREVGHELGRHEGRNGGVLWVACNQVQAQHAAIGMAMEAGALHRPTCGGVRPRCAETARVGARQPASTRQQGVVSFRTHTHTPRGLVLAGCVLARVSRAARRGEGTASEIDRKGNHRGQPRIKFGLAEGMLAWWRVTAGTSPAIGAAAPQQHRLGGWAGTRQQRCEGMEAGPQQHAMHAAGAQV